MDRVSLRLWRSMVALLLFTIGSGLALAAALASGAADPPFAGKLIWERHSSSNWAGSSDTGELRLLKSPAPLPPLPFTFQLTAGNTGAPDSAWGIWLETANGKQIILIDNQGYYSVSDTPYPYWVEFIHLRTGHNTLYLNADATGAATLRLNREVAWTGILSPRTTWGIVTYRAPALTWDTLQLYAPGDYP